MSISHAEIIIENPLELKKQDKHEEISQLVKKFFENSHYSEIRINDELSSKILESYIDSMDGNKSYLLLSDIENLNLEEDFSDISVFNGKYGKPSIRINNKLKALIKKKFKTTKINTLLSISDEKKYSIAYVIIEKK